MFTPRPHGLTLKRVEDALRNPHPGHERFDAEFPVAMRCTRCGKLAHGPRSLMREAMEEHWRTVCPARHTKTDGPLVANILFPRL
jgi:hypothetical protein